MTSANRPEEASSRSTRVVRWHPFLRFVIVGVVNTAVYYAIYLPLLAVLAYVVAHVLAWLVATIVSFLLNCRWTYGVRPTFGRALLYPLSSTPNLLFTTVGLAFLIQIIGVSAQWAPLIAGGAAVPLTYLTARWLLVSLGSRGDREPSSPVASTGPTGGVGRAPGR